ncbi:MAG: DNA polymerase III subunit alpha, partial [Clostridia bacterium]|nr:DNA polymerase III subunit alpha [Clostridia bacterium]
PGPMDFCPTYVENKHNPEKIVYDLPCLEPILKSTYGVIVYQEQVMQIVQAMAGYTLGRADIVRKYMSKKKMADLMKEREVFLHGFHGEDHGHKVDIDGAVKRGASEELANKIYDSMIKFGSYAFNKSHAAAYAFLTYQTAYLKQYYKVEFLTAVLNNRLTKPDDLKKYIMYARNTGIDVLPPDINKSQAYFSIENGSIRHGLAALKGMGYTITEKIINDRKENGDYKDLVDLISRMNKYGLNKRGLESLILSGALDCFGKTRTQLMAVFELVLERTSHDRKQESNGQISMFSTLLKNEQTLTHVEYPNIPEFIETEKLKKEKEMVGVYVTGHPLDKYFHQFEQYSFNSSMIKKEDDENEDSFDENENEDYGDLKDGTSVTFGGIITEVKKAFTKRDNREMAILKIEDIYGDVDCMVFPQMYKELKPLLEVDKIAVFSGKISIRAGDTPSIVLDTITEVGLESQTAKNESEEPKQEEKPKVLWLRFYSTNEELKNKIINILDNYYGENECRIRCSKQNQTFMFKHSVNANNLLLFELQTVLPEADIKLV